MIDPSRIGHIFRAANGHFAEDTLIHRQILIAVASRPDNFRGRDRFGNDWFVELRANGTQIWVQVRDDKITNRGVNMTPRDLDFAEFSRVPDSGAVS